MKTVGFIGLGIMGRPMAKNLLKAGYALRVCDVNPEPVADLAALGATPCATPRETAQGVDVVITMLPNSPEVKQVVLGPDGVLEGAAPGVILVDMSSIAPEASREMAAVAASKGIPMLDAPVSGGEPGAVNATLAIMVGGDAEAFAKVKDLLLTMGKSAVYLGGSGSGNVCKLANQIVVALNIIAISEAYTLAVKANTDPKVVFEAIKGGLAGSNVMNAKSPLMFARNFKPGFRIELHRKDLRNALDTGEATGHPLPFTHLAFDILEKLIAEGKGKDDHGGIVQYFEALTGVTVE
jgi:2-hydroxy-3-oxopropionate reductase